MARPVISVGSGVKVYEAPRYGRMDGVCTAIDNRTGIISAQLSRDSRSIQNIVYRDHSTETSTTYWTELPPTFVPGSEGH